MSVVPERSIQELRRHIAHALMRSNAEFDRNSPLVDAVRDNYMKNVPFVHATVSCRTTDVKYCVRIQLYAATVQLAKQHSMKLHSQGIRREPKGHRSQTHTQTEQG